MTTVGFSDTGIEEERITVGDLFSDFAEVFDSEDAAEDKPACGAKDRNATCIRGLDHPGWHRSKTGVCWPPKKDEKK